MNNTITVESLGKQDPVDNMTFDNVDEAAIDMTEIINYDKQTKVTSMVTGVENFLTRGQLDPTTALYLGVVSKPGKMDPTGGMYNSRFGGEGFFSTALKALENGILAVIRFVKKIVLWVVDKVKQLFGFSPSERQAAVLAEKIPELKNEIGAYFVALGFPVNLINLDKYLADMPKDKRRNAQLSFVSSKLVSEEEYMNKFAEIPPLAQQTMRLLGEGARRARDGKKRFLFKLNKLISQIKSNPGSISTEGEELIESMMEIVRALNYREVIPSLSKLNEIVTGQIIEDDPSNDFSQRSIEINRVISNCITKAQKEADSDIIKKVEQILAKVSADSFDKINGSNQQFDLQELYNLTDVDELTKVSSLSAATGDPRYLEFYRMVTSAASIYSNFAKATVEVLRTFSNTFMDISNWYKNATKFMLAAVAEDVKTICELMLKKQQEHQRRGVNFPVEIHANGMPKNLTSMSEADAQTAMEKMAYMSSEAINMNLLNVKDSLNNFAKNAGFGKIA